MVELVLALALSLTLLLVLMLWRRSIRLAARVADQHNVLTEQKATLAGLGAGAEGILSRLQQVEQDAADGHERWAQWHAATEDVHTRLARVDDAVANSDARLQDVDGRATAVAQDITGLAAFRSDTQQHLTRLDQQLADLAERSAEESRETSDQLATLQRKLEVERTHLAEALQAHRTEIDQRLGAFINGCDELIRAELAAQLAEAAEPVKLVDDKPEAGGAR